VVPVPAAAELLKSSPATGRPAGREDLPRLVPRWSSWEALAAFVLVALLVSVTGAGGQPLRALFGLPLVLAIPGHAVVALVWWGRALGVVERAALDLGISLALATLSGLALNWTPWGLGGHQSTILLGLGSLVAIAVLAVRDRSQASAGSAATGPGWVPGQRDAVLLGAAGALLAAALGFSAWSAAVDRGPGFTQAWMVPQGAGAGRLDVGLQNEQPRADTYRLRLTVDGRPVREWGAVTLEPGQRWSAAATLPAGAASGAAVLTVYRTEDPAHVYRSLRLAPGGAR
jgi:hypothetical protein